MSSFRAIMSTTNKQCDNKNSYQRHQSALLYTVKASILVLRVDLFYVVDDVVVQCSAEQPVLASQQSETKLKQRRRRNKTFTTQHHQRLTERLKQTHQIQMHVQTFAVHEINQTSGTSSRLLTLIW